MGVGVCVCVWGGGCSALSVTFERISVYKGRLKGTIIADIDFPAIEVHLTFTREINNPVIQSEPFQSGCIVSQILE